MSKKVHILTIELPHGAVPIAAFDSLDAANSAAKIARIQVSSIGLTQSLPFKFEIESETTAPLQHRQKRRQRHQTAAANVTISKRTGKPKRKYTRRNFIRGKRK